MLSASNPSKWSSGQPTSWRPGSSWGFGALLKGLTSVVDTSCQSRNLNPQPWVTSGFKSNALSIRPRLPLSIRPQQCAVMVYCTSAKIVFFYTNNIVLTMPLSFYIIHFGYVSLGGCNYYIIPLSDS